MIIIRKCLGDAVPTKLVLLEIELASAELLSESATLIVQWAYGYFLNTHD